MTPVMPSPVSIIFGKILTGSLVSSAMFTESSKPTIAKNASEVAAVTAKKALLSLGALEHHAAAEVGLAGGERVEPDHDDEQQAGQLDEGEHDVGLDALADAAEVDDRHQGHEAQRPEQDEVRVLAVATETLEHVGREGPGRGRCAR